MLLKYCAIIVLIVIWTVPHIDSKGGRGGSGGGSRGGSFSWGSSRMSSSVATSRPYTSNNYGSRTYYSNNYRSSYGNTRRTFASETATQSSSRASKSNARSDTYGSNSRSDGWYLSNRNGFNRRTSASNTYTQRPNRPSGSYYTNDDSLLEWKISELSNPDSFFKKIDASLNERLESSRRASTPRPASDTHVPNSESYNSDRLSHNKKTFASETVTESSSRSSKSHPRSDTHVSNSRSDGLYLLNHNDFNKRTSASDTFPQPPNRASGSHYTSDDSLLAWRISELSDPTSFFKKIDASLNETLESSRRASKWRPANNTHVPNSESRNSNPLSHNKITVPGKIAESSSRVSESRSASVLKKTPRNYVQHKPEASTGRSSSYRTYQNHSYKERNDTKYNETYEDPRVSNSYYSGGGSTKSAVLAGLGGSVIGLYLGHQLSNMNKNYHSYYSNGSQTFNPQYSVVHHYSRGDSPITRDAEINSDVVIECANITFCMPNTQPLCLVNGTIYCLTHIDAVTKCNESSTSLLCVNTTLTTPCLNSTDTHCNNASQVKNETIQIPCVTNLFVYGKLKIHQVKNISTMDTNSTGKNNSSVDTKSFVNSISLVDTNTTASVAITAQSSIGPEDPTISHKGTVNEFCVTVIAQPVFEPKNLTNAEFARYVIENEQAREQLRVKFEKMLDILLA